MNLTKLSQNKVVDEGPKKRIIWENGADPRRVL